MPQTGLEVLPTRTLYRFEADGVRLGVTFTTPALPHDLDLLSRPVTYVTWDAQATDGKRHQVSLYFDATGEWVVNQRKRQNRYGLPLDSRKGYTKLDWIVWSATMVERAEDFEALVAPVHRFAHESPSRVPLTDWYETTDAKPVGFQARSVVGGVFIKLLAEPQLRRRSRCHAG